MHSPRRSAIPSLLVCFACTTIASTVLAARDGADGAPPPRHEVLRQDPAEGQTGRKPFTHAKHVPGAWLDLGVPERQRDCRGCHDYGRDATRDPQGVCTQCHFSNETNGYAFSIEADDEDFLTGLESLRSRGSLFQHNNHLALECRECHEVGGSSIEAPILMPRTGGLDLCVQCHVGEKPRQATLRFMATRRDGSRITDEDRARALAKLPSSLVAALNGTPPMGPNRPGERNVRPFRHDDHILTEFLSAGTPLTDLHEAVGTVEAARQGTCTACHGPMIDAQAGLGEDGQHVPFDQSAQTCGACHISDERLSPLRFEIEHSRKAGRTAATYSHAVHLNWSRPAGAPVKSSDAGYTAIETEGCSACHTAGAAGGDDFALRGALAQERSFQGCQTCHETSPWAPVEHGAWWTHEDHGSWQSCTPCHDFSDPSFVDNRVFAEVDRARPARFRIESQSHPHITVAAGESIEATCAKCHRQPVKELPSRIREARFQHATHLPPDAGSEACLDCHAGAVTGAHTSGSLGLLSAAGSAITYDSSACATCHLGSPPLALPATDPVEDPPIATVPEFSHAGHIGKVLTDGSAVGCTTCHDPGPGTARGDTADREPLWAVGTRESARDCSMCHSHAPEIPTGAARAPSTGQGVTAAEVAACTLCHVEGLPVPGATFEWPTAQIVNLVGDAGQFHPAAGAGSESCSRCHIDGERLISASAPPSGSRVFASRGFYVEPSTRVAKPAIHRGGTRKVANNVDCFACHWTNTLGDSAGEGSAPTNPERAFNRQSKGDDLRDFPGGRPVASNR